MGAADKFTMGTIRCLQRHGIPHQVMDYQRVKQAYPMIEFPRDYTFVVDKSGGILRADKALLSYQVRTVTCRTGVKVWIVLFFFLVYVAYMQRFEFQIITVYMYM